MDSEAFLTVVLIVIAFIGLAFAAMSVGVMLKRPCVRGSFGGAAVRGADGEAISCVNCPNRAVDHS